MSVEPVVAIAAIEHFEYCPRQCALIHVDGIWADNVHTVRGERAHARADTYATRLERGVRVVRAMALWSERLGLTGRADAVEFHPGGAATPVEYKIGARHGDAAHLQLAAQAMCLEDMFGRPVAEGAIWFSGPRRRERVPIDDRLRERSLTAIAAIRDLIVRGRLPGAIHDARCRECQLIGHCLPEVVGSPAAVTRYIESEVLRCEF
ncbi:MAG: CRISPR-associated protein Cas4 [Acidimicrobiales bacterium]